MDSNADSSTTSLLADEHRYQICEISEDDNDDDTTIQIWTTDFGQWCDSLLLGSCCVALSGKLRVLPQSSYFSRAGRPSDNTKVSRVIFGRGYMMRWLRDMKIASLRTRALRTCIL